MTTQLEDRLRVAADTLDLAAERYERIVPADDVSLRVLSRRNALIGAAAVTAAAVAGGIVVLTSRSDVDPPSADEPTAPSSSAASPATTTIPTTATNPTAATSASPELTTTSAGPATTNVGETASALADVLHLPPGWSVTDVMPMPEIPGGLRGTTQLWSQLAADRISFVAPIQLNAYVATGRADEAITYTAPGAQVNTASWIENGVGFSVSWIGYTSDEIAVFISAMVPRDPTSGLAGFDVTSPPLQLEQIGDGGQMPTESWINVNLANLDGQTCGVTVYDRVGLPQGLAVSELRVRVGDRIAITSPQAFTDLTGGAMLDWAGAGIQYRVQTTNNAGMAVGLSIAEAVNAVGDETWLSILHNQ